MVKKGWFPLCAVLAVAGLALFSVVDIYGTKMSAKNLRSEESLATLEMISSSVSVVGLLDCTQYPEQYQGYCTCIEEDCAPEVVACSTDELCRDLRIKIVAACLKGADGGDILPCLLKAADNPTTIVGATASKCIKVSLGKCN
mmetsp:Transcript_36568/g.40834  ORF Transcript_36568/g.40834 Transcript_36568/m.40834 type:complete len:143 (+) Transcript_36568:137-565(+)|eukprot:CAMPEP_0170867014 /NCGR_PEP_ID=MMETSP0734-20130129/22471_1 /TAXON_ID=186038 /ORGANISM="Fragilariopsis kerguelensis, Strain L26-C5" /LENGTH=142 /DNA_ID=CAMNT_0011244033 /DNA_START=99 /DNA_END=527 /DNA_ORIENTATION=+